MRAAVSGIVIVAACLSMSGPNAAQTVKIETVTDKLRWPHAMAFLPSGDILIAEQDGKLVVVRDGQIQAAPIRNVPPVFSGMLRGFVDIAVDPAFAENSRVYLAYSEQAGDLWTLVVAKATLIDGALERLEKILDLVPSGPDDRIWGGYLTILPDGTLLIPVADGGDTRAQAQNLASVLGKVLRIDENGHAPPDNPFLDVEGARPEIYSYGHRHIIGVLYDAVQGIVYANENGPYGGDEINTLKSGNNYGWPLATYGIDYSGAYVTPYQEYPGTEPPVLYWVPSIAPSGMAQCRDCMWPEWEGNLFSGALSGKRIQRVAVRGEEVTGQEAMLSELGARIRDVEFGPDGALYAITDEAAGRLLKVTPGQNN